MPLLLTILLLIFITWSLTQLWQTNIRGRAPWFPTLPKAFQILQDKIKLEPNQSFAEIGAGSGRLALAIAERYPHNSIYAYEIAFVPFAIGWLNALKFPNVKFIHADFKNVNLDHIDVFYSFTSRRATQELSEQLTHRTKPALLYSYAYRDQQHPLIEKIPVNNHFIFVHQVAASESNPNLDTISK